MGLGHEVSISFDSVRDKNVMQLKKLNLSIFPVNYDARYYADALASPDFTKLAYYGDICAGSIACRVERKDGNTVKLYIMTLGVLAPYRRLGIGSKLMNHVLECCERKRSISEIYLHVQTNNEEGLAFYRKFGFDVIRKIENYYTDIEPPDCYLLVKVLSPPVPQSSSHDCVKDI